MTKRTPSPADGATLRRLRLAAGWSQQELARRSGVGQASIQKLESGEKTVTLPTARRLCVALNSSLSVFDHPQEDSEGVERDAR